MAVSRRTLIGAFGGAGVALIGAGGYFVATRTPHRAFQAWRDIEGAPLADKRLDAFRYAILAPNPHNRQPWQIQLAGDDGALIFCDLERRLPQTDPFDRQILIGFGCFLELARIAAAERGVRMEIDAFPDGEPRDRLDRRPIARLKFAPDGAVKKDPLFSAVPSRRSNKAPFDTARPVEPSLLEAIAAHGSPGVQAAATADGAAVQALRALTWEAWNIELQTKRAWQESVDLMRIGKAEIEANPDGISLGGPLLEALALAGMLSRELAAQPGSTAYSAGIDRYRPILASGMAYAWIVTQGNSRQDQLASGRAYVRMNLEAARRSLGFHPVSQALQEFPEMAASFAKIHAALGAKPGQRVQMLARIGYGGAVAATPRWPMESHVLGA